MPYQPTELLELPKLHRIHRPGQRQGAGKIPCVVHVGLTPRLSRLVVEL